ncbi:MAG: B12-binding domain-containing protein, partial [Anaerolineales bacterium]|nr:B12-binding domain-containing protein [Anaerolineales bacterium]
MITLEKEKVLAAVKEGLDSGIDPLKMVDEARDGLEVVGDKFDQGEYFL